ncbi:unnamed protein product [Notodromas monacha]|uniref:PHD finger protein 14 n=1 Tax=Notodromas monacha TaxID=399045 RepID=A0A7R9BXP3_9CRUS|nr:unnamed protein product [Notodromas monacha]CAG0922574.1 unnamed protein product [Notodromas monacha]
MATNGEEPDGFDMQFLFRTLAERDPSKRKVKPAQHAFMDMGHVTESSSDDEDYTVPEDELNADSDAISDSGSDSPNVASAEEDEAITANGEKEPPGKDVKASTDAYSADVTELLKKLDHKLICCACLGMESLPNDELIECDGCGIMIHEGCYYGIPEDASESSSVSSCSSDPWFCDACKAGNFNPRCELCPNTGGAFKETDAGHWVHIVCALFVRGVAFVNPERLEGMTLFELSNSAFGSKACAYCEDVALSKTGVCVVCDAGMCRIVFHGTCGQKEGLLLFPHEDGNLSAPGEQVDPYLAHCKLHSEKSRMRDKKTRYNALHGLMKMRVQERIERSENAERLKIPLPPQFDPKRMLRKLMKQQTLYEKAKASRGDAWVPTERIPRLLNTSPESVINMRHKITLMNLDPIAMEDTLAQQQSIADIGRKHGLKPAFSVEFVAYFIDRSKRMMTFREELADAQKSRALLAERAKGALEVFEEAKNRNEVASQKFETARNEAEMLFGCICDVSGKTLGTPRCLEPPPPPIRPFFASPVRMTSNARKLYDAVETTQNNSSSGSKKLMKKRSPNHKGILMKCTTCDSTKEQHSIVTCDTCHQSYHMACVVPPLERMPKKTKLYGWQCNECVAEVSTDSEKEAVDTEAPRKLRGALSRPRKQVYEADSIILDDGSSSISDSIANAGVSKPLVTVPKRKKKRSEGDQVPSVSDSVDLNHSVPVGDGSPETSPKKKKRRINVSGAADGPHAVEDGLSLSGKAASSTGEPSAGRSRRISASRAKRGSSPEKTTCDVCNMPGTGSDTVRCDECKRCFHFQCLDPPVLKSPKVRGYSWHCEDCDNASETSDGPRFSEMKETPKEKRRSALRELDKQNSRTREWVAAQQEAAETANGEELDEDGVLQIDE